MANEDSEKRDAVEASEVSGEPVVADADAGTTGSGGGSQSPQDLAVGTQPTPVGTGPGGEAPASQTVVPDDSKRVPSAPVETADADFTVPESEARVPAPEAVSDPKASHQGQYGSGVAPGAALPGESVQEREARRSARVMSSELFRAADNGNIGNRIGTIEIGDEGGFDVLLHEGIPGDESTMVHLSDLLRGRNGQRLRIGDISFLNV